MQPHEMGNSRARALLDSLENNRRIESLSDPLQARLRSLLGQDSVRGLRNFLRGDFLGHPLHAALTDVPLGSWTAAVIFDLASLGGSKELRRAAQASVAVGVVGAVGAAATGLVDWTEVEGKQQRVGVAHALLNTVGLVFQVASLGRRRSGRSSGRLLTMTGFAFSCAAAYLGGKMVYELGAQVEETEMPARESGRGMGSYPSDFTGDLQ